MFSTRPCLFDYMHAWSHAGKWTLSRNWYWQEQDWCLALSNINWISLEPLANSSIQLLIKPTHPVSVSLCINMDRLKKDIGEPSRWWPSGKSLGSRGLLPLWSQVRTLWLLIWWPLEAYMVVNFRTRGISRGASKLVRTPTLN
jgi:hypothetical protein